LDSKNAVHFFEIVCHIITKKYDYDAR